MACSVAPHCLSGLFLSVAVKEVDDIAAPGPPALELGHEASSLGWSC